MSGKDKKMSRSEQVAYGKGWQAGADTYLQRALYAEEKLANLARVAFLIVFLGLPLTVAVGLLVASIGAVKVLLTAGALLLIVMFVVGLKELVDP